MLEPVNQKPETFDFVPALSYICLEPDTDIHNCRCLLDIY